MTGDVRRGGILSFWVRLVASMVLFGLAMSRFLLDDWLFGSIVLATALVLAVQLLIKKEIR